MERDFMGLAKAKVKDEASEEPIDAAPVRTLTMQWPFSNKNSTAIPQIVSFHGAQQEKPKTGFDSLASNGLVSITTSEAFNRKLSKNVIAAPEKQGLPHYNTIHHHPQTNQSNVAVHSFAATNSGHNPTSNHVSLVGTTGLRSSPNNNSVATAQLTIFYNGSVCAYDNISPEKAQAIMLLAGNGTNTTVASSSSSAANNPIRTCMSTKPSVFEEGLALNPSHAHATTTHLWPSPLPVTSVWVMGQPGGYKGGGISASTDSDTVPQFRKKSLARFLEKRKERVISSSPYGNKQSEDWSSPSEAVSRRGLCTNSSGSSSIPLVK